MKLIGLAGAAGSGKDTVAEMILDQVAGVRMAFADPLKRAAREIFGLTDEQMTKRDLKEQVIPYWGLSPRQILQRLGTECIREQFGRDTWLKRASLSLAMVEANRPRPSVVVFADVRFQEEARWIQQHGGIVVQIHRPGVQSVAGHSSEQGVPNELLDSLIVNAGGIDDLRTTVATYLPIWLNLAALEDPESGLLHAPGIDA